MPFNTLNTPTKGVFKKKFPNYKVSKKIDNSLRALCLSKSKSMHNITEEKNNTKCFLYYCTQELINSCVKKKGDNNLYHIDFKPEMVQDIHSKLGDLLNKNEIDMRIIEVLAKKNSNDDYIVAARLILAISHYDNKDSKLNFSFSADFTKSHMDGINFEKRVYLESSEDKIYYQSIPEKRLKDNDKFLHAALHRVNNDSKLSSFKNEISASKQQPNTDLAGGYATGEMVDPESVGTGNGCFYSDDGLSLQSSVEINSDGSIKIKSTVHPDNLYIAEHRKKDIENHIQANPDYKHNNELRETRQKFTLVFKETNENKNTLVSTATSMKDTFSTPGITQNTKGGGEQRSTVLSLGSGGNAEIDYELTLVANMPIVQAHSKVGRVNLVRNLENSTIDCYFKDVDGNDKLFHSVPN